MDKPILFDKAIMSRSPRTDPTQVIASRRSRTQANLDIRERPPKRGDIHPLNKKVLRRIVADLPADYIYGLTSIELRARQGRDVGLPFGEYLNDEKVIRINSLPPSNWIFGVGVGTGLYEEHGAEVQRNENSVRVHWGRPVDLAYFVYREVLLHELGHHYHNQYRTKRPNPKTPAAKEASANRHADVLSKSSAFQRWHD